MRVEDFSAKAVVEEVITGGSGTDGRGGGASVGGVGDSSELARLSNRVLRAG